MTLTITKTLSEVANAKNSPRPEGSVVRGDVRCGVFDGHVLCTSNGITEDDIMEMCKEKATGRRSVVPILKKETPNPCCVMHDSPSKGQCNWL